MTALAAAVAHALAWLGTLPEAPPPPPPPPVVSKVETGNGVPADVTAYCLTGVMANGERVFDGAVAANRWPLGTRLRVVELGRTFTVADRSAPGATDVDVAMPGRCGEARRFGRQHLTVEVLP